jgi:hypothetical protein
MRKRKYPTVDEQLNTLAAIIVNHLLYGKKEIEMIKKENLGLFKSKPLKKAKDKDELK